MDSNVIFANVNQRGELKLKQVLEEPRDSCKLEKSFKMLEMSCLIRGCQLSLKSHFCVFVHKKGFRKTKSDWLTPKKWF